MDSYIAIDLETTGLNPKTEKIIEIGALRILDGAEEARFHRLVNPRRKLSPEITALTGITDQMVENGQGIEEINGDLAKFCGDLPAAVNPRNRVRILRIRRRYDCIYSDRFYQGYPL